MSKDSILQINAALLANFYNFKMAGHHPFEGQLDYRRF